MRSVRCLRRLLALYPYRGQLLGRLHHLDAVADRISTGGAEVLVKYGRRGVPQLDYHLPGFWLGIGW